jgi:hypothetical protein
MSPAARVVVGPTFAGSADVGGADGDLLINGTLLEIKTRLKDELQQRHLHQIVGYALLDYDDAYGFRELAMFSARHASLIRWPIGQVIEWLAGTPTDLASSATTCAPVCAAVDRSARRHAHSGAGQAS